MEPKKIKLMRHHIPNLIHINQGRKIPAFLNWTMNKSYGKEFNDKVYDWIRSLDPKNTVIEVIDDKNSFDGMNLDEICLKGCPYIDTCKISFEDTFIEMAKKNWYLIPYLLLNPKMHSFSKKKNLPSGEYKLDYLIDLLKK